MRTGRGAGPVRYRLYGIEMASDRPLRTPVPRAPAGADAGPPDVRLEWSDAPDGPSADDPPGERLWASTNRIASGAPAVTLHRADGEDRIRYTEVVEFRLPPGGDRIECRVLDSGYPQAVEIYLLGLVLAYWLERQGRLALHGSGLVVGGRGVAFLGAKGSGKSSLAAAFLAAGARLLTDDLLSVEARTASAAPAYPQLRMWPDLARRFVGSPAELPAVEPGGPKRRVVLPDHWDVSFADETVPLGRIYVPERRPPSETTVRIEEVAPREAVVELVGNSFLVAVLQATGLQAARLDRLGELVSEVPVRRLVYPSGWDRLPEVREAVAADMAPAAGRGVAS